MREKYTADTFIQAAMKKHGVRYDYSLVDYVNSQTKVIIICREHGNFAQQPNNHVHGQGCPVCGKALGKPPRMTYETFVERAREIHGDNYDYDKVLMNSTTIPVEIICKKHGSFLQTPSNHLSGKGCKKCAGVDKLTTEQFIERAREVHGDRYDYSSVDYETTHKNVQVICREHGIFCIPPVAHIHNRRGCQKCQKIESTRKLTKPVTKVIEESTRVHGDKYTIVAESYVNRVTKMNVVCKIHGMFSLTTSSFLAGRGCPSCAKYGFDPSSPSVFYLIDCDSVSGSFTGYGITKNISQRTGKHIRSLSKSAFVITQQHTWDFPIGSSALALENAVKKQFPQTSRLGCDIEGFKRESTDAPFEQVKEFIESILKENPEWQLT